MNEYQRVFNKGIVKEWLTVEEFNLLKGLIERTTLKRVTHWDNEADGQCESCKKTLEELKKQTLNRGDGK